MQRVRQRLPATLLVADRLEQQQRQAGKKERLAFLAGLPSRRVRW